MIAVAKGRLVHRPDSHKQVRPALDHLELEHLASARLEPDHLAWDRRALGRLGLAHLALEADTLPEDIGLGLVVAAAVVVFAVAVERRFAVEVEVVAVASFVIAAEWDQRHQSTIYETRK